MWFSAPLIIAMRPPKYKSVKAFQDAVDSYFESIESPEKLAKPTITGLMYHLGFASRQSFYDIIREDNHKFSYVLSRGKLRIEMIYEEALLSPYAYGAKFALEKMGWGSEKQLPDSEINPASAGVNVFVDGVNIAQLMDQGGNDAC